MTGRRLLGTAAALATLAVLCGCSAGSSNHNASSGSAGSSSDSGAAVQRQDSGRTTTQPIDDASRSKVYSGQLTISARSVSTVADAAVDLVTRNGGEIDGDDRQTDSGGRADITIRVVPTRYQQTLDALAKLSGAHELSRSSSVRDVTTSVADIDSRVRSQQASVARIRELMSSATSLDQIVSLESDLSDRESTLESLQAQQRALRGQVQLATIELHVQYAAPTAAPKKPAQQGFLTGLKTGTHGFVVLVTALLTVLGALLPFLVTGLVIGTPAYVLWRRRRRPATQA